MRILQPALLLLIIPILQAPATLAHVHQPGTPQQAADQHSTHQHAVHQHGAHQHGIARMELIKLGNDIQLTFFVTGADLLGFEHRAQSPQQQQQIEQAEMLLADGKGVVNFDGATCRQQSHQSDLHQLHQQRQAAAADPEKSQQHQAEHADLTISYQFSCTEITAKLSAQVQLFALFPALQKIETSWITDQTQSSMTLSATANRFQIQ